MTAALPSATVAPGGFLLTVKSSISLTDEHHAFVKALVDSGRYSNVSAIIQQSIEQLRQRLEVEDLERRGTLRNPVPPPIRRDLSERKKWTSG